MIKKFLGVFFFYFAISSCNLDINDKPKIIIKGLFKLDM